MSPMSQQMNPAVLTSILSDPRAQPAQRMAAMSMLKQLQGGANSPMAAPQGDGTGAMDMDPSFVRAVQQEMKNEQAPQGMPPAQGQQMDQGPQDAGVQGDIAAGVKAASGFARGGAAVSDYQANLKRLARITGITDPIALKAKMDELEEEANPGFFKRALSALGNVRGEYVSGSDTANFEPQSVDAQLLELEAAPVRQQQAADAEAAKALPYIRATQTPVGVVNPDELDLAPQPAAIAAQAAAAKAPIPKPTIQQRAAAAMQQPSQAPAVAAAPVVAAMPGPAAPVDDGGYAERMKKLLDDDEGDMTPREKSMALIQAGAAMMAGASRPGATFLGSAGEGLTKGLEGFNAARSERAVKRMKQAALLQAERQAGIENTQRDKGLTLQERQVNQGDEKIKLEQQKQELEAINDGVRNKYYLAEAAKAGRPVEPSVFKEKVDALIDSGVPKADAVRQAAGLDAKQQAESVLYDKAMDDAIKLVSADMSLINLPSDQKYALAQKMAAEYVAKQRSGVRPPVGGANQVDKVGGSSGGWGIVKD